MKKLERRNEKSRISYRKVRIFLIAPNSQSGCQVTAFQRARDKYFLRIPSTPVPHLFKTNDIPSDEDRVQMRSYISQLQRIVVSTETSPFRIEHRRGDRAHRIATRHVQLLQTNIRYLPPEIIQRVVYFTLSPPYTRKQCSPWVASWVCSSWRRAVLGHHHLWGILPEISFYLVVQPERKTEQLQELLRRSGDAPLTVSIHFLSGPNRDHYNHILLDLLLEHSHRFADVRLNLNPIFFSTLIMPTLPRWHRLHHFSLRISGNDICPEGVKLDLRLSTSLRSIDIPGSFWSQVRLPPHLETPTLYSTSSLGLALEDFILTPDSPTRNLAASATKLVLPAFVERRPSPGEDLSPVFAPRVTEIVLYDSSPHHSRWARRLMMLDGFVTPCLQTLKISFFSSLTLTNLAPRLSDATLLTTLHLLCPTELLPHYTPRDVGIPMETLTALLESTPNVVEFKIFDDTSSYSFIHLLANFEKPRKDRGSYSLPRLKHLTIFVRCDIRPRVLDLLHSVAINRMDSHNNHFSRLETLEVVLNHAGAHTYAPPRSHSSSSLDVGKFGTGPRCSVAPYAAQDRVRGIMEGWLHSKGLVGPASHFQLVATAEDIRDVQRRLANLSQSGIDKVPVEVFKDVERCLENLAEGLDSGGSLRIESIETVYVRLSLT